jgi:alpha-beta hydrolase superfamily lysophospholipase
MQKQSILSCTIALLSVGLPAAAQSYPRSIPPPNGCPEPIYQRLNMTARDGIKLVMHVWAPPDSKPEKPVVLFIHGIGFHGEPYGSVASGFTCQGITLAVPDLRGHGRSEGESGELAAPHVLRADIGAELEFLRQRHPKAPLVLAGESMGGLVAADYAWRGEQRLAGLVLLVPAFGVHRSRVRAPGEVGGLLRTGRITLDNEQNLLGSTRDKDFPKAKLADQLTTHAVRPIYLTAIAGMQLDWPRAASELKMPLFIGTAGNDQIVDNQVTERVLEGARTPKDQKTWRQWNDAYHTLCWDPLTPRIFQEVAAWVLQRR